MSSATSTGMTLEELPDEILLFICRYLSSTEILFSFYALNTRLSQTITGYSRHVVLAQLPFRRFSYICESILPHIGAQICTLVISNDWKGVLSKVFLSYFDERMASTFPSLRRLVLTTFVVDSLMAFLASLRHLPNLVELKINSLYEMGTSLTSKDALLRTMFTANESRLTSILLDDDSLSFSYEITADRDYTHVKKLVIELTNLHDLHRLLTDLSQLQYIDVSISDDLDTELDTALRRAPVLSLKHVCLRSVFCSWTLDELVSLFPRIPNVQQLIIQIATHDDHRLFDGQQFYTHLSKLALKEFTYFLQFDTALVSDNTDILSTWQQFPQQVNCIQIANDERIILYSLPFQGSCLILPCPVAKDPTFSIDFGRRVQRLTLYEVSSRIAETFSIIAKCPRLQSFVVNVDQQIVPQTVQEVQHWNLPCLTFFVALRNLAVNIDDFQRLLQASPNLYHMALDFEVLNSLLNSEKTCELLGQRVTDLLIGVTSPVASESVATFVSCLARVCPSLRHLYFHFRDDKQPAEPLILAALAHLSDWKRLVSFGIAHIALNSTVLSQGIREWVLQHSLLHDNDSFLTDYSSNTFRLWL